MLIKGRGGRGSKLWFGKRRFFNIYVFFSLWIKKKTSKYSKANAVKNLKLSSSMWSYHCKKFGVGESLKKKSYKSEGEEVPSPSLPPPHLVPEPPCWIRHWVSSLYNVHFSSSVFFYIYFNRMHPSCSRLGTPSKPRCGSFWLPCPNRCKSNRSMFLNKVAL